MRWNCNEKEERERKPQNFLISKLDSEKLPIIETFDGGKIWQMSNDFQSIRSFILTWKRLQVVSDSTWNNWDKEDFVCASWKLRILPFWTFGKDMANAWVAWGDQKPGTCKILPEVLKERLARSCKIFAKVLAKIPVKVLHKISKVLGIHKTRGILAESDCRQLLEFRKDRFWTTVIFVY